MEVQPAINTAKRISESVMRGRWDGVVFMPGSNRLRDAGKVSGHCIPYTARANRMASLKSMRYMPSCLSWDCNLPLRSGSAHDLSERDPAKMRDR
jgi:hypothetical protein